MTMDTLVIDRLIARLGQEIEERICAENEKDQLRAELGDMRMKLENSARQVVDVMQRNRAQEESIAAWHVIGEELRKEVAMQQARVLDHETTIVGWQSKCRRYEDIEVEATVVMAELRSAVSEQKGRINRLRSTLQEVVEDIGKVPPKRRGRMDFVRTRAMRVLRDTRETEVPF